jgi:hypothetical protein
LFVTSNTDLDEVADPATTVRLSYRVPGAAPDGDDGWELADSEWIRNGMAEPSYRRYLRYAHAGPVAVDDEFEEFVNCGCASPEDVVLRVEAVEGGSAIGRETTIEVVHRRDVLEPSGVPHS